MKIFSFSLGGILKSYYFCILYFAKVASFPKEVFTHQAQVNFGKPGQFRYERNPVPDSFIKSY